MAAKNPTNERLGSPYVGFPLPFLKIIADIFSPIAGVASLIDVALKGCNVLCDSINYLKVAPELARHSPDLSERGVDSSMS